jgi:hypothetical protein
MGDLRPDGNGLPPDDGGSHRDELPDFPPEWGPVIIPDDASELDGEAQALRRELRRHARQTTLRSALGLRKPNETHKGPRHESSPLGVPAVIMTVAVLTTLISLFVVIWGHQANGPSPSASPTGAGPVPASTAVSGSRPATLVDTILDDANGQPVRLGSLLPAVVLLVDRCDCAVLVPQLAAAAPPGVTIVPVAEKVSQTNVANIHALADPKFLLRAMLTDPTKVAPTAAIAVLLDSRGAVVYTDASVKTAAELTAQVAKLAV